MVGEGLGFGGVSGGVGGKVSAKRRQSVGKASAKRRQSVGKASEKRQKASKSVKSVKKASAKRRQSVGKASAKRRQIEALARLFPTCGQIRLDLRTPQGRAAEGTGGSVLELDPRTPPPPPRPACPGSRQLPELPP